MNEAVLDFQTIHADFRPKIQRYLTRMVGEYEAEDLTQEVFVKISQALHTFRGESKLSTWIYRIASNAALDRMRSPSFKRIVPYEFSGCSDSDEMEIKDKDTWTGDEAPWLDQQLLRKERAACYQAFVENLPEHYRRVIALSELEELAANEIADILGLSVEAVKMRLHRGRTKLLQELRNHCKAEDWL
jgi:RNA polymerase sigma-70 factor (ECF subfamily)